MKKWMNEWLADPVLEEIVNSRPLQRLKDISFLGAIDYTGLVDQESKAGSSRWEHTLGVAALTDFVAHERQYDEDIRRHLVAAALLHDIGHAPLSHSAEPYFKHRLGYGHHYLGEYLLENDPELSGVLNRHFDAPLIKALIAGDAGQEPGGDLFASPINVDTIDGILRSLARFNEAVPLSPRAVARAAFLQEEVTPATVILDRFWRIKGRVYNKYITSALGVMADDYCRNYFDGNEVSLTADTLMETEDHWRRVFPGLFSELGMIRQGEPPTALEDREPIDYVARRYFVATEEEQIVFRYQVEKTKRTLDLSTHDWFSEYQEGERDGSHRAQSSLYH